MKKVLSYVLVALIFCAAVSIIGFCVDENHLIVPGQSVGEIMVGKPITQAILNSIGKITTRYEPVKTMNSGCYICGNELILKLNDCKNKYNVNGVYVFSPDYETVEGIKVNDPISKTKPYYTKGLKQNYKGVDYALVCPEGIIFGVIAGKISEIYVGNEKCYRKFCCEKCTGYTSCDSSCICYVDTPNIKCKGMCPEVNSGNGENKGCKCGGNCGKCKNE